jgi:FMN-dependent NADH-azoreductase
MSRLIHIQASPRIDRSSSSAVATCFIDCYRQAHPTDTVDTLDLWQTDLPEMNGALLNAGYSATHGQPHSPEQSQAWQSIVKLTDRFKSADKYLISLPMWNFSIPYKLKHYIDLLVHRGLTFSITPEEGYKGLVTGKPLTAVYARGGAYAPGTPAERWDHQSSYLKHILGFVGFTDIREIFIEPTERNPVDKEAALAAARRKAEEMAACF